MRRGRNLHAEDKQGLEEGASQLRARRTYLRVKLARKLCRFNMLATASTREVISALDSICTALMQMTGCTREQFAVIHPGGAADDRLAKSAFCRAAVAAENRAYFSPRLRTRNSARLF